MQALTYILDRFCWAQNNFPGWSNILPEQAVLMPYQGWTPPIVIGDGKCFWEIHADDGAEGTGQSSPDGFIRKQGDSYTIQVGRIELERQSSIEDAISALQRWRRIADPFTPQYVYRKPEGRLRQLLADPHSILILLCGWKGYRREKYSYRALSADEKRNSGLYLSGSERIMAEYGTDQERRTADCRFEYREEVIPVRTEEYTPADYRYDSVVKVLPAPCCENPAAVEYFKLKQLELAERLDLDAVFMKQGTEYYGLGCRHQEFFGEFDGFLLRQLANYQEILPLKSDSPREAMFEFLEKVKNQHYVLAPHSGNEHHQHFVDEQLPRLLQRLGSMWTAMRYYSKTAPFRRSQWERHIPEQMEEK